MNYLQKKKLAFMSIVNSVKGFIRTITGVFPLTLTNCVDEESITDYTIYGDSVQNGTPTPDNPIEVESVGEKTKNLFDVSKSENGTLDSGNGTDLGTDKYPNRCRSGFIFLTAGSYVVSFNELVSTGNYIHTYYSNNASSWIERLVFSKIGSVSRFTLTNDCYVRFTIQPINTNSDLVLNTETLKNYQPQLELGNTATVYEPYGYKIPITVGGKNLFDIRKITGGIGVVEYNGVKCFKYADVAANKYGAFTYTDAFKENTRYTFTIKVYDEDANKNAAIKFTYTDGTTYSLQIAKMNTVYKYTTTAGKTLQSFTNVHSWGINRYIDLTVTQLEEGTSSTEWEAYHEPITTNIYLGEPLSEGQSINYKKDRLPNIPTFKGTTVLSADTTVQPSNAEVIYYSTLKE